MPPPTHVLIEFAASDGSPSVEWQLAIEDEDREFITVAELRTRIHAECALPIAAERLRVIHEDVGELDPAMTGKEFGCHDGLRLVVRIARAPPPPPDSATSSPATPHSASRAPPPPSPLEVEWRKRVDDARVELSRSSEELASCRYPDRARARRRGRGR